MSTRLLGRVWRFFKSKELAVLLITCITASSVMGMLISQPDKVFTSWWFIGISGAFIINLTSCTLSQVIKARRVWKSSEPGHLSIWALIVIHVGLIIIVLGGFISAGFKMTGYMTVMEGEVRTETQEEYDVLKKAPLFGIIGNSGYGIGLQKQQRILDREGKVDYIVSEIILLEGDRVILKESVEEGKPLIYKGLGFYEHNAGFAPLVTIEDSNGNMIYKGFIFMETVNGQPENYYQRRNFTVPGRNIKLDMRFYPDMVIEAGQVKTQKYSLGNPGLEINVTQDGLKMEKGIIKMGEKINFEGNSLSFDEVRHWIGLEIIYDPGAGVLFTGCLITAIGLCFLWSGKKSLHWWT